MRLHAEAKEPRTDGEKRPVRAADALHAPKLADAGAMAAKGEADGAAICPAAGRMVCDVRDGGSRENASVYGALRPAHGPWAAGPVHDVAGCGRAGKGGGERLGGIPENRRTAQNGKGAVHRRPVQGREGAAADRRGCQSGV